MQIPANPALGAPGAARQVNTEPRPRVKDANPSHAGRQADAVRKSTQAAGEAATDLARARSLEQAVHTLADQGRLPPRGSLIDLRA